MSREVQSGRMQYQYACWGDLNRDGFLDVAMIFVSKSPVNNWDWHDWLIVAFHGNTTGNYNPTVITKDRSGCLDGVLYEKAKNEAELICFGVGGGSFKWDGKRYVVRHIKGD